MNIKKQKQLKLLMVLLSLVFGLSKVAEAATPPTDLTSHASTLVVPAGTIFEWHNALPISPINLEPNPSGVVPGIYYAVYNFGAGCYSAPTAIKVVTNNCPDVSIDLPLSVDSANKPIGTIVTYHNGLPISASNQLPAAYVNSVPPGTYYTAYFDAIGNCYTQASVIVYVGTTCASANTNLPLHISSSSATPIGAIVEWTDSAGNTVVDPTNVPPGLYTAVYNFGNGCFSTPSKIRIATNVCPSTKTNIVVYVDSTKKPDGTIVSFHTALPVSAANRITNTQALAVDSGTYYTAYFDPIGACFSDPSVIVVAYTNCFAIPLGLKDLEVSLKTNKCNVNFNWKISNQENIHYFEVMRKAEDELQFSLVEKVNIDINKTLPANYGYVFTNLQSKKYQFQLNIVDVKKDVYVSNTLQTSLNCNNSDITIYPNPINNYLNIRIASTEPEAFEIRMMDVTGKLIIIDSDNSLLPSFEKQYNLSNYANGIYNIIVTSSKQRQVFKVVKSN